MKKRRLYFLLITWVLAAGTGLAQNPGGSVNRTADSLLTELENEQQDTVKLRILVQLSEACDPADILKYAQSAVQLADKILQDVSIAGSRTALKRYKASAFNNIGFAYMDQGKMKEALDYYSRSLKIQEEINDKPGMAGSLNNIGYVYDNQGQIKAALDYYGRSLKIQEEIGDKKGIATSLHNIGYIYQIQGQSNEALEYFRRSLTIKEEIGDKGGISRSLSIIGAVYQKEGAYATALEYFERSLIIREEIADKKGIAWSLNSIGTIYDSQGQREMALEYLLRSLKIREEIGDKQGVANSLCSIGIVLLKEHKLKDAEKYALRSLQIANEIGFAANFRNSEELLANVYSESGNFEAAFSHYKQFIVYRDKITNEENTRQTVQQQMQYEFDKQQAADSIRNAEMTKQEQMRHDQEIQQQRTYMYGGIAGFILMLAVAGVSFRAYMQKQKANAVISRQKAIVEEKQREILDSIHYAKRIQVSLLPRQSYVDRQIRRLSYEKEQGSA